MNKKTKFITTTALGAVLATPVLANLATNVRADNTGGTLTVHKLAFLPESDGAQMPQVDNKALPLDKLPEGLKSWDKATHGDVGFMVKVLTAKDIEAIPELKAKVGTLNKGSSSDSHYTLSTEQINAIKEYMSANPYETKKSTSLFKDMSDSDIKLVDESGKVQLKNFDTLAKTKDAVAIIIEEAKTPTGFTTAKAEPVVIPVPLTNADGTGYMTDISVYPKNKIRTLDITLNKLLNEEKGSFVDGAKFDVYKGEPGSGVKQGETLTVKDGKITVKNVSKGKYYLVEVDSDKVIADNEESKSSKDILLDFNARNDKNNQLVFEVSDTVKPDNLVATFNNYTGPTPDKEVLNPLDAQHNGTLKYTGSITIPKNIGGSKTVIGDKTKTTLPYTVLDYIDHATGGIKFKKDVEVTVATEDKALTLNKDEDYEINYASEEDMTVSLTDSGIAKLKGHEGKKLQFTYEMSIDKETLPTTELKNEAKVEFSNDPSKKVKRNYKKEVVTKTYGIKFKKVDDGLFGTGIASEGLEGAEFLLKNTEGDFIVGYNETVGAGYKTMSKETDLGTVKAEATKNDFIFKSKAKGEFEITGLKLGKYKLQEIKAPTNYQLATKDYEFEIKDGSYTAKATDLQNTKKPNMPLTGSEKIVITVGAGLLVLGIGAAVTYKKRKTN